MHSGKGTIIQARETGGHLALGCAECARRTTAGGLSGGITLHLVYECPLYRFETSGTETVEMLRDFPASVQLKRIKIWAHMQAGRRAAHVALSSVAQPEEVPRD